MLHSCRIDKKNTINYANIIDLSIFILLKNYNAQSLYNLLLNLEVEYGTKY
jgi:hypothetical protein